MQQVTNIIHFSPLMWVLSLLNTQQGAVFISTYPIAPSITCVYVHMCMCMYILTASYTFHPSCVYYLYLPPNKVQGSSMHIVLYVSHVCIHTCVCACAYLLHTFQISASTPVYVSMMEHLEECKS